MQHVKILVRGKIDEQRSDWFQGLEVVSTEPHQTILTGQVVDQSALFGLLTKIRDLGLALVSVQVTGLAKEEV